MNVKLKRQKYEMRRKRTRAKIFGTVIRPRLSIFRSNKHIYLQAVNDEKGATMASASDLSLKADSKKSGAKQGKMENAKKAGEKIAKELGKKKIKKIIFDRAGYKYHGRIKAAAEGIREGGIEF